MSDYQTILNSIPKDWEVKSISELGVVVGGGTPTRDISTYWNGNIPWITPGEVSKINNKFVINSVDKITEQGLYASGANLLPEGSLLVTSRATLGARAICSKPMATNQGFKSIIFNNKSDAGFYYHFFGLLKPEMARRASGTTFLEISSKEFSSIPLPYPPDNERTKIAHILDTVDTEIQQTELLIEKLQLVKEGLLNDLLTRGIGVDGQLRPSFQQAPHLYKKSPLGWIPKEWHTGELDNALNNIEAGKSPSCPDIPAHTGEWGVLKVSAVHPDGFREHENKIVEPAELQDERYEVKSGDLLITRANTPELVGLPCLVHTDRERLMLSDKTLRLHVKEGYEKAFIFISLTQPYVRSQIQIAATGTSMSMKNISQNSLKRLNMKFPPHAEQVLIAERILDAGRRISEENALLKKMEQQKAGLMDDLLTGKVRVTKLLNHQPPAQ